MGYSDWSKQAFDDIKVTRATQSVAQVMNATAATVQADGMDPKDLGIRESRDSAVHPESLSIAIWLDETGSMGRIPYILAREKFGTLMDTVIKHGIAHPQILFGGIGDHYSDRCPLQVGQYESGTTELDKWLTSVYLEGNGGGQNHESYPLGWIVCARHTSLDCVEKRGQKAFCFTIGDEAPWMKIEAAAMQKIFGKGEDVNCHDVLRELERTHHVFHIHVNHGGYANHSPIINAWRDLLGERLLIVDNPNSVAEVIAATVAVVHGADLATVVQSFDPSIRNTVSTALIPLSRSSVPAVRAQDTGIIKL